MRPSPTCESAASSALCLHCGIPLDSQPFDVSGVHGVPERGDAIVLTRFDLPPQYCGVLQFVSQFTDAQAAAPEQINTPSLEWRLLSNGHPLSPYLPLRWIVNPWGFGSFPVSIRLDEGATIELEVRRLSLEEEQAQLREQGLTSTPAAAVQVVGGRIMGRFWYDAAYGNGSGNRY